MRVSALIVAASVLLTGSAAASAQTPDTVAKGPRPGDPHAQYFPDPTHIPFFTPDEIPWQGTVGRAPHYNIYGDPRQPGPYAQLLKWYPGSFSKPHFHGKVRHILVVSGTWWVSSSAKYDPAKTYPIPAGSLVTDVVNTVHWDGAKDVPVVLMIVGDGPAPNVPVDENGQPIKK